MENEKVFVNVENSPAESEMSNPSSSYSSTSANFPYPSYLTNSSLIDSSLPSPFVAATLSHSVSPSQETYIDFGRDTMRDLQIFWKRQCEDEKKKTKHEYKNQSRNVLIVHHDVSTFNEILTEASSCSTASFQLQNFQNKMSILSSLEPIIPYQSADILRNPAIAHNSLVELMLEIHKYLHPVSERVTISLYVVSFVNAIGLLFDLFITLIFLTAKNF